MASEDEIVPSAPETEASALSYLIAEGPQWWPVLKVQAGDDPLELFFSQKNRLVARAMDRLCEIGVSEFTNARLADEILSLGGERLIDDVPQFLIGLQTRASATTGESFREAVALLVQQKTKRDQLDSAEEIAETILRQPEMTPADVSNLFRDAAVHKIESESLITMRDIIDEIDSHEGGAWAVPTGLERVDAALSGGGLEAGRVYVLAARSKVGKTTVAFNIQVNTILWGMEEGNDNVAIAFFSLETLKHEFYWFTLAVMSGVDRSLARKWASGENVKGSLDAEEVEALTRSKELLRDSPIYPYFSSDLPNGLASIENKIVSLKSSLPEGTRLIAIIDHVQLLSRGAMAHGKGIRDAILEATSGIKRIATDYEIPIILVSQLNRGIDGEAPVTKDLSESGSIEQDADTIILINRPAIAADSTAPTSLMEINIARQRGAPPAFIEATWDGPSGVVTADLEEGDGEPTETMTVRREVSDQSARSEGRPSRSGAPKKRRGRQRMSSDDDFDDDDLEDY